MTTNKLNKDARINLLDITGKVFDKYILPMSEKEFLSAKRFDDYYMILKEKFVLNEGQWEEVLMQWDKKKEKRTIYILDFI